MSERDKIFGRIREALRVPAPIPGAHDHKHGKDRYMPYRKPRLQNTSPSGCRRWVTHSMIESNCSARMRWT